MTTEELLKKSEIREIKLSESDIINRKTMVLNVMHDIGYGILDEKVIRAIDLFCTGQITSDEIKEFIHAFTIENSEL